MMIVIIKTEFIFGKIPKQKVLAGDHSGHMKVLPHIDSGTAQRGRSAPNPMESIPWLQAEGDNAWPSSKGGCGAGRAPGPIQPCVPKVSLCSTHHGAFGTALAPTATPELLSPQ